ncbi:lytic transglycosylase domain-containing protein [Deinococcus ruber]|uniref:Transglycosylase SLT domain-containing protein n=1 Tax=Deinococcus ruber TaxID=1848197 RepID=A0A918C7Y6_9DEIO|nr:lytic transglycosylase domain-containing protein [Deinococcus ruber]GGR09708.1 hypothetical protein GCM10008957_23070 [Deinococcus ruber]
MISAFLAVTGGFAGACGGITQPQWQLTKEAARYAGLDPLLLTALTWEESGYCKDAVSSVGAQGLTQLMPATAREVGVSDPFDERQNLYGGALYLRAMYQRFQNWSYAILAYHDGATNVSKGNFSAAGLQHVSRVLGRYEGLRSSPVWNSKGGNPWR